MNDKQQQQQQQQQQQAHHQGDTTSPYCCFHPREVVVGVCAHCLKDRLLLLLHAAAADAPLHRRSRSRSTSGISLPKVLALGSSFLQRLDSRHHRHDAAAAPSYSDSDGTASASPDDSFISIKFEDNGKATWDSKAVPAPAPVRSSTVVVAAEHAKRGGVTRWRKQVVGRLLQLARWKRSAASKAACQHHAGQKAAAVAGERSNYKARGRSSAGWIRSIALTRRRAADGP